MTSLQTSPTRLSAAAPSQLGLPNIAFVGKAGAGKTTASDLLTELGYHKASFAAALKDVAAMMWGDDARTDRSKLQPLGTEVARLIDPDVWVNLLLKRIRPYSAPHGSFNPAPAQPVYVVDDCRFENEWFALKAERFVMVRLLAEVPSRTDRLKANGKWQGEEQLSHVSETAIDHLEADHTIVNDGSTADLYDDIVDVILRERRRRS